MVAPLADVFQAEEDSAFVRVESEQNSSQPVFSGQERMDQASLGSAARNFGAVRKRDDLAQTHKGGPERSGGTETSGNA
jgi:hypothetical protein